MKRTNWGEGDSFPCIRRGLLYRTQGKGGVLPLLKVKGNRGKKKKTVLVEHSQKKRRKRATPF